MIGFGVGSIARGGLTTTGNSVDWSGYGQGGLEGGLLGLSIGSGLGLIGRVAGGALGAGTGAASTTLAQGGSRLAALRTGGSAFGRTLAREGGKLALAQTPKGIVGGAHGYASARAHGARASSAWWSAGVGAIGGLADASNATYYAALGAGGGALIGGGVGYVTGDAGYGALRGSQVGGLLGGLYGGYRYARGLADRNVTGRSVWWGGLIGPEAKVGLKAASFDAAGAVGGGAIGFAASGGDWDVALQYAGYGQMVSGLALQTSPRLRSWLLKACFAAGMHLLTPEGSKAIEVFRVGDLILSRSEFDADGAIRAMEVLEIFVRTGRLWKLRVSGKDIWTTGEHPFHVADEGRWKPVSELREGERLSGHNEVCGVVEEVYDTGEYATVYNLRVAEYHTYFVGCEDWGWSAWAHNARCIITLEDEHFILRDLDNESRVYHQGVRGGPERAVRQFAQDNSHEVVKVDYLNRSINNETGVPVYSNLYPSDYDPLNVQPRYRLIQENGRYKTVNHRGKKRTARGEYVYIYQNGEVWVGKVPSQRGMGQQVVGHIDLARNGTLTFAGEMRFGNGRSNRGKLQWWNHSTGHYRVQTFDSHHAPLPPEAFRP